MLRRAAFALRSHKPATAGVAAHGMKPFERIYTPRMSGIVAKRSFFVRGGEVPEHLKHRVFHTWNRVFGTMLGLNTAVWAAWQTDFLENAFPENASSVHRLASFLQEHFTVSKEAIDQGNTHLQ